MLKSETFIFSKGFSFYMIGVYRREDFHQSKLKKIWKIKEMFFIFNQKMRWGFMAKKKAA